MYVDEIRCDVDDAANDDEILNLSFSNNSKRM